MSVNDLLGKLMRDAGAQRVLCLRAEWDIHSDWRRPTKVWIEREVCAGLPRLSPDWQGQPANGRWEGLLLDLKTHQRVQLFTHKMPNGKLKNAYLADGIKYAEFVTLGHWREQTQRYLACHWTSIPSTLVFEAAGTISMELARELRC